jgi:ABC-type glutathione transport system ATPase component
MCPALFGAKPASLQSDDDVESALKAEQGKDIEPVSATLAQQIKDGKCVIIRNLCKSFNTNTGIKHAVDDLNLTMYSGQITALLGHNGAGAAQSQTQSQTMVLAKLCDVT